MGKFLQVILTRYNNMTLPLLSAIKTGMKMLIWGAIRQSKLFRSESFKLEQFFKFICIRIKTGSTHVCLMKLLLKISAGNSRNQVYPSSQSHDYFISNTQCSVKSSTHHSTYHSLTTEASFRRTHAEHYLMKLNPISRTNNKSLCRDTAIRYT